MTSLAYCQARLHITLNSHGYHTSAPRHMLCLRRCRDRNRDNKELIAQLEEELAVKLKLVRFE